MDGTTRIPLVFPTGSFAVSEVDDQPEDATMPLLSGGGTMRVADARQNGGSQRIPLLSGSGDLAGDWITADELSNWTAPDEGGGDPPPEYTAFVIGGVLGSAAFDIYSAEDFHSVVGSATDGDDNNFGYYWFLQTDGSVIAEGPIGPQTGDCLSSEAYGTSSAAVVGYSVDIVGHHAWVASAAVTGQLPELEGDAGINYEAKSVSADGSVIVGKYTDVEANKSRGIAWILVEDAYVATPITMPEGFDADVNYAAVKVSNDGQTILVLALIQGATSYECLAGPSSEAVAIAVPENQVLLIPINMSADGSTLCGLSSPDGMLLVPTIRFGGSWYDITGNLPAGTPTGFPVASMANGEGFTIWDPGAGAFGVTTTEDGGKDLPLPEGAVVSSAIAPTAYAPGAVAGTVEIESLNNAIVWLLPVVEAPP